MKLGRRLRAPWLLWGLGLVLAARMQARDNPFDRCEARVAQAPDQWESARCFFEIGRDERIWDEAARRLETLTERHPDRPWLRLARAYVEGERDARYAFERFRSAIEAFIAAGHTE